MMKLPKEVTPLILETRLAWDILLVTSFLFLGRVLTGVLVLVMFSRLSYLDLFVLSKVFCGVIKVFFLFSRLLEVLEQSWSFRFVTKLIWGFFFAENCWVLVAWTVFKSTIELQYNFCIFINQHLFEGKFHTFHFFQCRRNISRDHRSRPGASCLLWNM